MTVDWGRVQHFIPEEFGDHAKQVNPELVYTVEAIRQLSGTPVNIHLPIDGPAHAENSWHHKLLALDFHFGKGLSHFSEFTILSSFSQIGGIGFYPEWSPRPGWHIDLRPYKIRSLWFRVGGDYYYGWEQLARVLSIFTT